MGISRFSKSLYYPSMDIDNEQWLKSAILFWDEISTIVPEAIGVPYKNYSTQYLYDIGILAPIYINPHSNDVYITSSEIAKALDSVAGRKLFYGQYSKKTQFTHCEEENPFLWHIHDNRMLASLCQRLEYLEILKPDKNGYYQADRYFLSVYMTLLANQISESKALALVTDNTLNFQLSEDERYAEDAYHHWQHRFHRDQRIPLKQGMLTNLVIDNIIISEDTLLSDIVAFRQHRRDELARFRVNLAKLADSVQSANSFEALQQNIQTAYYDEFVPAYNDLKSAMKSSKIKWFVDNISKFCAFSVSTTTLPVVLGVGIPQALFIGAGVSAVTSVISYNIAKKETLRKNPYTYLLNVNKEL